MPKQPGAPLASPGLVVPVRRWWLVPLLAVGLVLALTSAALQLAKARGFEPASLQLDRVLSIDEDLSILNWLTASTFLLAGLAAAVVAGSRSRRRCWIVAAVLLVLVSLDEAVGLHDPLSVYAEDQLRRGGLGRVLVVLGATAAAVVVTRVILSQAPAVRWRVAAAVALVLLAAVGIDALGPDLVNDPAARLGTGYVVKSTAEEALELGAAVLVLDAMLLAALTR